MVRALVMDGMVIDCKSISCWETVTDIWVFKFCLEISWIFIVYRFIFLGFKILGFHVRVGLKFLNL